MRAFIVAAVVAAAFGIGVQAQDERLNGTWTLNRTLSDAPREVGFTPGWLAAAGPTSSSGETTGGGRGGRGSRGGGSGAAPTGFAAPRESAADTARMNLLTAEVKSPSARLSIIDEAASITIDDDNGKRTFHPTARAEALSTTTNGLPDIVVTTRREGDRLVVTYNVETDRQLRYTYSTTSNPRQLVVDVEFVEPHGADRVHRVYDRAAAPTTAPASAAPGPAAPLTAPRAAAPAPEKIDQRPDAELKGLVTFGLVVEELSPQAAACGLNHDALDGEVFKRLSDAGFTVRRKSDDDTYLYVNVMTTSASNGLCVSRYDVTLYSHTVAKLTHTSMPVLVQAELLHTGGIAGGTAAAHAASVQKGIDGHVDEIVSRIRNAKQ